MGLLTLANFRTDLQSALGDRGITDGRLDRWINFGYLDLAGAVEFEILANDESIATTGSTQTITAPTNTLIIQFIKDTTSDNLLGWIPKQEMFRRAITPTDTPLNWTRHKTLIYLHPVPDGIFNLMVATMEPPAALSSASGVSLFPDTWDPAIFMLSVHHALLALGEEQRSSAWLARGITYIQSRITEQDLQSAGAGLGASIPSGMGALQARLSQAQGA